MMSTDKNILTLDVPLWFILQCFRIGYKFSYVDALKIIDGGNGKLITAREAHANCVYTRDQTMDLTDTHVISFSWNSTDACGVGYCLCHSAMEVPSNQHMPN